MDIIHYSLMAIAGIILVIGLIWITKRNHKNLSNGRLTCLQDELQENAARIARLEAEKEEWLLERQGLTKDLHDRVINILQIVVSLLKTQSVYLHSEAARKAIQIGQQRIYAISLIHHILNQSSNYSLLNMREYTYALVENLKDRLSGGTRIQFMIQVEDIYLDLTQSTPLGLIMNEAISNAMVFGFPGVNEGIISVKMKRDPSREQILLTISDNGVGLTMNQDVDTSDTFGIRLMEGLTSQLGGSFKMQNGSGVKIDVHFPDVLI